MVDILLIGVISVISAAETWKQMVEFAKAKEVFLKTFLELPNGIPSEDTINRLFSSIDPVEFEKCFSKWVNSFVKSDLNQILAIDGKTIRGAKQGGKKSNIHMVSAWACETNMVLGQVKTAIKSNEITAIPELLKLLDLKGNTVTIDAMGTQKNIASMIIDKGGNYILALKGNQSGLLELAKDEFMFSKSVEKSKTLDGDHGRIETRKCSVVSDFKYIKKENGWKELKSVIKIESLREFKNSDKKDEKSTRYYISNKIETAEVFLKEIRSHWAVENKLHWILDVAFHEDYSRKRAGNSAQNYSVLLKTALNLLKNEKTEKQGIMGKRLKAGWDVNYLLKVLGIKV